MPRKLSSIVTTPFLFVAIPVLAGDLNPPAGPVAPTHKTLTEVEPRTAISLENTPGDTNSVFRITEPGSYYLTGNVIGVANDHGIEIAASNVTVDLMGFSLIATPGDNALDGITGSSSIENILICNGTVVGWGGDGIDMTYSGLGAVIVKNVNVLNCGINGIDLQASAVVLDCKSEQNGGEGIACGSKSIVERCVVRSNGDNGIDMLSEGVVKHCIVAENSGVGIQTSTGVVIAESVVQDNAGFGIETSLAADISNCIVRSNDSTGIKVGRGSMVADCAVQFNDGYGIQLDTNCSAWDCTVYANDLDGILVSSESDVRNNNCTANGNSAMSGSGILATGSDNRIDNNQCTDNDYAGITVQIGSNLIVRNTVSGNTVNLDIDPANNFTQSVGPVGAGAWDNIAY